MRHSRSEQLDVIVVGGGLGGGFAAWQLTQYGKRVLLLEQGEGPGDTVAQQAWYRKLARQILRRLGVARDPGYQQTFSYFEESAAPPSPPRRAPTDLGRGLGGSSTLYSAALGRMRRSDFEIDRPAPEGEAAALPNDWPIDYEAFRGYYRRAEDLLGIRGECDPHDADDDSRVRPAPALSASAEAIRAALLSNGLNPYRLRVGIEYREGCRECFGRRCAFACKADGYNRAIRRAEAIGGLSVETEARVLEVFQAPEGAAVRFQDRTGQIRECTAARLVLAAGALNSPLILERSERLWRDRPKPAMLGRGLMFHVSDIFMVRAPRETRGEGPRKWLALRDYYDDGIVDLGEIQSVGYNFSTGIVMTALRDMLPGNFRGPLLLLLDAVRPFIWLGVKVFGEHPLLATITEDLPVASNRVREEDGRVIVTYTTSGALRAHAARMRDEVKRGFRPFQTIFLTRPGTPNWGHPMGTCRMGIDPETSVVTPEGRLHDHANIFVADASTFPSSGGTGPALTVAAHALRVADAIARDLIGTKTTPLAAVAGWSGGAAAAARPATATRRRVARDASEPQDEL